MDKPAKKTIYIRLRSRQEHTHKSDAKHRNFNVREIALQGLFQIEVGGATTKEILELPWVHSQLSEEEKNLAKDIIEGTTELEVELDTIIQKYSKKSIPSLSNIVKCVLRMGTYEILKQEYPAPVIIDTCCTLARKYDGDGSAKYVNAVLDKIYKYLEEKTGPEKHDG